MNSGYERAVDGFLGQIGRGIFRSSILNRIWMAFMAYCMCIVAEAFKVRGYKVTPQNCQQGFIFKLFPAGDPDNYSYFTVKKENEEYEIRLNIYAQNLRFNSLRLNVDIAVVRTGSINDGIVNSEADLLTFAECKNLRGFPELVATIEGMAYELQRKRLYNPNYYRIPSCLLLSGSARSIQYMNKYYMRKGISIRIFDLLQPGSPSVQDFIQSWF